VRETINEDCDIAMQHLAGRADHQRHGLFTQAAAITAANPRLTVPDVHRHFETEAQILELWFTPFHRLFPQVLR